MKKEKAAWSFVEHFRLIELNYLSMQLKAVTESKIWNQFKAEIVVKQDIQMGKRITGNKTKNNWQELLMLLVENNIRLSINH